MRLAALVMLALMLGACTSWDGDSSVTLKDGTVYRCTALGFLRGWVYCGQKHGYRRVPWEEVAGYRAGESR